MRAVGAPRCMSLCRELGAPRLTCGYRAACAVACQFVVLCSLLEATEAAMDAFASSLQSGLPESGEHAENGRERWLFCHAVFCACSNKQ